MKGDARWEKVVGEETWKRNNEKVSREVREPEEKECPLRRCITGHCGMSRSGKKHRRRVSDEPSAGMKDLPRTYA